MLKAKGMLFRYRQSKIGMYLIVLEFSKSISLNFRYEQSSFWNKLFYITTFFQNNNKSSIKFESVSKEPLEIDETHHLEQPE